MTNKKATNYRLSRAAIEALNKMHERSGRSKTCIIEDALIGRRQYGEEA